MVVYCVFGLENWHDHETHNLLEIYSSEDLAQKDIDKRDDSYSDYYIREHEVKEQ